jgi:transcriptional regulator with XRE-family HTH domain
MEYSFGNWIKHRRKAPDLTQQEPAKRVGCSDSLIFKIESDERRPEGLFQSRLSAEQQTFGTFFLITDKVSCFAFL